jgi:hypothetical protein
MIRNSPAVFQQAHAARSVRGRSPVHCRIESDRPEDLLGLLQANHRFDQDRTIEISRIYAITFQRGLPHV